MTEEMKQCSKCKMKRTLDNFENENKNCNICLEARRRYRQKHNDKISQYNKEYYKEHKTELLIKSKEKREEEYVDCFYCNDIVNKYDIGRHVKSLKHISNMERIHNETDT